MKRKHSLLLLPLLCLASCGKTTFAGKYSFLLGRDTGDGEGTKIGLTVELSDQDFTYKKSKKVAKYFGSKADMLAADRTLFNNEDLMCVYDDETHEHQINYYTFIKAENTFQDNGSEHPLEEGKIGKKLAATGELKGSFGDIPPEIIDAVCKGINGYYLSTNFEDERYGTRIHLGTFPNKENIPGLDDIYTYIEKKIGTAAAELVRLIFENYDSLIDDKLIEYALCAYCDGNTITLLAPVSIKDLQLQLAWYGKFVDFDDDLVDKIHTIRDLLDPDTLIKLLSTAKHAELTAHRTKITGQPLEKGELVLMPGKQGEERFGSEPIVNKDVNPVIDEVDSMNKIYANEFANTLLYEDAACTNPIGAITSYNKTMEGTPKKMYYYYDRANLLTTENSSISGYVLAKNEDDDYKVPTQVKVSLNHEFTDPNLGIQIGNVADSTEKIIEYDTFYKTPFTFRAFHRLPLTLKK